MAAVRENLLSDRQDKQSRAGWKKRRRVSGTEEQGRDPRITATVQDRGEAFDAAGGGI